MAKSVAIVATLEGQAWAKAPDGTLRPLKVGDTVAAEEVVVTAEGARIELDFGDGHLVAIAGGKEVTMDRDLWTDLAADNKDAAVDDASVQEALTILNNGGDLTETLEETAAGLSGGGSNEGHSFVELARVVEATDPQAFNFAFDNPAAGTTPASQAGAATENNAPILLAQSFSGDEDTVISGQVIANDPENDVLTYAVTGQPANGTLVLDAATGAFSYTPNANYNGPDSFVVTVTDDHGNVSTTTIAIGVNSVNDAPVSANQNLTTAEDTPVTGQVVATDVEGDTLAYSLSTLAANGTVTLNPATGAFTYTPGANFNGSDTFVVTISDGNGGTTTSTITVGVTPVNDAPVSANQNLITPEDTPVNGTVAASDVDGDTLSYAISGAASNGSVTLNPLTGAFVYTPNANYNGSDSFVVTISDGQGGTTTSTITVGVTPVNDAPVSSNQNLTTAEDTALSGAVVATDVEGDTLTYTITGAAANGSVALDAVTGAFVYTPNANYNGGDSFVVTISDGQGGTTTSTINIGVTPVNDVPVSSNQSLTTLEDTPLNGAVVASDLDGDALTYSVSGGPFDGIVSLDSATGAFVYTPNANYNGSDVFTVVISDGKGGSTTSIINIGVTPVNDAPQATNQNLATAEDTPISGAINATDADGDALTYTLTGAPANGSVTMSPTGTFVYAPNTNYSGGDSFVVTISDGKGGVTTSTINIGVTPVNDAPVSSNQNLTTAESTPLNGAISATDIDGGALSYAVTGAATNGTVTLNPATGTFVYTPTTGYNGTDSFTVTISDGNGGTTTSTVNIGVTPVNDDPIATNDVAVTDESTAVTVAVRGNDTDPDGDTLTVTGVTQGANGSVVIDAVTGNPIYTPNAGFNGGDSFTYTVSDGNGGTATATVSVTVNALNDDPVTSNQTLTTPENTPVNGTVVATDADGDSLTYSIDSGAANGTVILNSATGAFTYHPGANYNGGDSFVISVSDGNGGITTSTITVGVTPVNVAPVAADDSATTDESTAVTIAVRANDTDLDGDTLQVSGVTQGANGSVVIDAITNNPIYTPNAGFTGSDSFTYTVEDGNGGSSTATVTVTVNPVVPTNNAPVAVADTITVSEGGVATILDGGATSLLANDTDAENDPLDAILVTGPAHGSLVLNANGTFSYTHDGSETTADSFTYKVNDGTVDGNTVTVNIAVTPVNENPVANDDFFTTNEDVPVTITLAGLAANDTDPDGDTVLVFSAGSVSHGSLALVGGNLQFTPEANYSGPASFTYGIHDGNGHTDFATVHITVLAVDDPTVLAADTNSGNEDGGSVTGNVLGNDTDIDTSLSVVGFTVNSSAYSAGDIVTIPTVGSIQVNADGSYTFSPVQDYNGAVPQVTYTTNTGDSSTLDITINPENDKPVANDDTLVTNHDTPVIINLPGLVVNDTDIDGDALAVFSASSVNHGTLAYVGGNLTFTPDAGFVGTASFTYGVHDGHGGTDFATVYINVLNAAPVSGDQNLVTAEDTPLNGNVVATDANGDALSYSVSANATNGSVTLDGATGAFVYTPNPDYNGPDSFTVTITDNFGGVTTSVINIGVTPANDAPVANADSIVVLEGGSTSILVGGDSSILDNDADTEGDALAAILVSGPANGTLTLNADGTFNYTHNGSNTTSDSFTYKVNDGSVDGNTVTVNIAVTQVNNAPVAVVDNVTVAEGGTLNSNVLTNDSDADGDTLTAILVSGPSNGSLTLNADGSYSYIHNGSETTTDSFTYKVNDGTVDGNTVTVNINVTPANDAPVSVADSISVLEGGTATVLVSGATSVLANDTDAENNVLSAVLVTGPAHGTLTLNANGTFSYTHDGSDTTVDSFTYRANDGTVNGNIVTVNIGVTPMNDAPVSSNQNLTTPEDTALNGSIVATDTDGGALTYVVTSNATNGSVSLDPVTGAFTYTPSANYNGSDSFVVTISDGNGGSTTSTINIGVTPLNDAPVAVADSINVLEGGTATVLVSGANSLLANDSDVEGNTLSAVLVTGPAHGTLTLNANGTFSYTHDGSDTTVDSFTYRANDGTVNGNIVTVNIGVTPMNDAPVSSNQNLTTPEDTPLNGSIVATDTDGGALTYVVTSNATNGSVSLDPVTGAFTYTPSANYNGSDSFVVTISDGNGGSTTSTINIGVTPLNDAPVAVADSISVLEGGTATVLVSGANSVLANDSDVEGSSLSAVLVAGPSNGTLTLNANGTFSYTHNGSETTSDSFTYRANDGTVNGNIVTVNISVLPVNDAPVAVADSISVGEGGTATLLVSGAGSVLANDTDAEGNSLTAILVTGPSNGTLTLNANGTFSYTHNGSETTSDSFTYRVNDGTVNGNTVTVNIGVIPGNDAPVAVNDPSSAAYSVQLGDAAANDLWSNVDSKGQTITINAYKTNGTTTNLYTGTVDSNANVLGVGTAAHATTSNTPRTNNGGNPQSDVPNQIEYDVKTGKSESLELSLNGNINSATFAVSRLYPGESGGEIGMWSAYYKGTLVTSGTFRLSGSSNAGSFSISTGSLVFDSIKFSALGTNDGTGDGADYFLTSFSGSGPASANTNYTVAEGATLVINSASSYKLLSNDSDVEGNSLSVSQINGVNVVEGQTVTLASGASLIIHTNGSFDYSTGSAFNSLAAGQVTTDSFTYTVSDGNGGTATATATMTVIGKNLTGTLGADTLVGGSYGETIMGLAGSDNLTGGLGADTFKWSLNDQGSAGSPATDTITDFNTAQGDVLSLKDVLQGESSGNITNYLHFSSDGTNTTVSISSIGAFNGSNYGTAADQTIVLNGVNLTGTDTDIINQLKNNGNLLTD